MPPAQQLKLVGEQVARNLAPAVLTALQIELFRLLSNPRRTVHLKVAPPPKSFLIHVKAWPHGIHPERLAAIAKLTTNTTRIYVWRGIANGLLTRQNNGSIMLRKSA